MLTQLTFKCNVSGDNLKSGMERAMTIAATTLAISMLATTPALSAGSSA
jgi:hypothetical protein